MKSLLVGAALAALALPLFAQAQDAANGEALFDQRCGACHAGGGAPSKTELAKHTPAQIVDILTSGAMAPMASGLSDGDKLAIATFLTASTAAPAAPAASAEAPATNAPATNAPAPPAPATNAPVTNAPATPQ